LILKEMLFSAGAARGRKLLIFQGWRGLGRKLSTKLSTDRLGQTELFQIKYLAHLCDEPMNIGR
jgi:hypothetical protein